MNTMFRFLVFFMSISATSANAQNTFKVKIEQKSELIKIKSNVAKVDKAPVTFIVDLPGIPEGESSVKVRFISTMNKKTYKRVVKGESIKKVLGQLYFPYSLDVGNQNEFVVVGEDGYSQWYYSTEDNDNVVSETIKAGNRTVCKIRVKNLFINNQRGIKKRTIPIQSIPEKYLYFCFELCGGDGKTVSNHVLTLKFAN